MPKISKYFVTFNHVPEVKLYLMLTSGMTCFRSVVAEAAKALRNAAGNYYVNDKSTGSIVAQQPFGGSRASGKK